MPFSPTRKYEFVTDAQATYLAGLVDARFAHDDDEGRQPWRQRFSAIRTNKQVSAMITDLQAIPTLRMREQAAIEASRREHEARRDAERQARLDAVPSEDGYYRNPETGELYRITHSKTQSWELIVAKYSTTGGPRRLVADDNEIVKGKFKRLNGWDSRRTLPTLKKEWLIDATTLAKEYAYGFCPLHNGPLSDGISVILGYGKDCAEKHGLPWSQEAAQAVLDARAAAS